MTSAPASPAEAAPGFFGILGNLFVAPSEAFAAILKRPVFVGAPPPGHGHERGLLGAWLQRVDGEAFMKARFAESPRTARHAGRRPSASHRGPGEDAAGCSRGSVPCSWPSSPCVIAGALVFIFRFFFAGEVTFRQGFSMTSWVFVATGLVTIPLLYLTLHLKDDWTLDPQSVLQANPSLFVEKGQVGAFLFSLLGSLDLFSFWGIALLAMGFGLASREALRIGGVGRWPSVARLRARQGRHGGALPIADPTFLS